MAWWIWAVGGLALLVVELLTPGGFFMVFFGAGAFLVALLTGLDVISAHWVQWLVFAVASVLALLFLRKPLMGKFKGLAPGKDVDNLADEVAVAMENLAPNATGKVEMRGSAWNARNVGTTPVNQGQRLKVEKVDGLMLSVRAE